ncbi:hypothetical protein JTY60_00045 [symbiont of Argiope bruennichi]|uniref:hypothetical protein n=1 Tax=symbiont of Argiope bruennichi TaxID=2810479 RepID=UPI003DA2B1EF
MYIYKIPNAKRKKIFYFFSLPILFFSAGCSTSENSKNQEIPLASVTSATNMNDYKNVSLPIVNDFSINSYYFPHDEVWLHLPTDWQILAHDFNLKNILSANSLFSFNISINLNISCSTTFDSFNYLFTTSMFSGKIKDFLCDGEINYFKWGFDVKMRRFDTLNYSSNGDLVWAVELRFKIINNSIMLQIVLSYETYNLGPGGFWAASKINISDTFDNKNFVNFFN